MSEAVLVALITGGISLVGTVITVLATSKKTQTEMKVQQAVFDTKLDELTREVRTHNDFAHRVPVLEEKVKVANHRLDDLERKGAAS